ncbi:hypothetical protein RJJ65_03185 [Rhizobium hidalgonense]|uniref:Uncharacterized protein n=1 Tax=Rhizobium hidalgonense TaxID=1538159 RepID=A0AAJ2LKI5_9HYPH|nr:hypothetical protein [Rhizobium hidalgonense]MDR9771674.1 hypothetical protein [Rhizobium hidalgonense]
MSGEAENDGATATVPVQNASVIAPAYSLWLSSLLVARETVDQSAD